MADQIILVYLLSFEYTFCVLTALLNKNNVLADEKKFKLAHSILISKLFNRNFQSLHEYLSEDFHR